MDYLELNIRSAEAGLVQDLRTEVPDKNTKNAELKIWIIVRKDLKLSLGKFGPQAAHAAGTCMVFTDRKDRSVTDTYLSQAQPKITVGVDDEAELVKAFEICRAAGLVAVLVKDAGRTELEGKTLTVCAVGPCLRSDLPGPVKRLQAIKPPSPETSNEDNV